MQPASVTPRGSSSMPSPGEVGAHTRWPAARSLLATGCQAHPPCHAPCVSTKFSVMVTSSSRLTISRTNVAELPVAKAGKLDKKALRERPRRTAQKNGPEERPRRTAEKEHSMTGPETDFDSAEHQARLKELYAD